MTLPPKGVNAPVGADRIHAVLPGAGSGTPVDDVSALPLTEAGRVRYDQDFVYFDTPTHTSGAVTLVAGTSVDLDRARVPAAINRMVIASVDSGTFGRVTDLA